MLYTYLSASKDDTNDELRTKYKKLCRTIHPDKADANNKEVSLNVFREVESAYEILSDPLKKLIYDNYGLDGLDYYQNFGEHFELAYQEADPTKRYKKIDQLVTFYKQQELNHKYIQYFTNQSMSATLNLVEFTTLKTLPDDILDVFSLSQYSIKTGAFIGKNGTFGKINFDLASNQTSINYSASSSVNKEKFNNLPYIGRLFRKMELESMNFIFSKNLWNSRSDSVEMVLKRKEL